MPCYKTMDHYISRLLIWGLLLTILLFFMGCATIAPPIFAGAGGALGSIAGPEGAALGALGGASAGQMLFPSDTTPPPPEGILDLLSRLADKAFWIFILFGIIWLVSLFAPPPQLWFKSILKRVFKRGASNE